MNDTEALKAAEKIIAAQDKLLIAYRLGGRPPGAAIDTLTKLKPVWERYVTGATA